MTSTRTRAQRQRLDRINRLASRCVQLAFARRTRHGAYAHFITRLQHLQEYRATHYTGRQIEASLRRVTHD